MLLPPMLLLATCSPSPAVPVQPLPPTHEIQAHRYKLPPLPPGLKRLSPSKRRQLDALMRQIQRDVDAGQPGSLAPSADRR